MRIEIKGRKVAVSDDLRQRVERRFEKISRQVSPLAELEVELSEERNPRVADSQVAEATLHMKGTTLRACTKATSMVTAINEAADDLARQVKRHRDKQRARKPAPPAAAPDITAPAAPDITAPAAP
jgi:putative sigma-54 modulation protein